MSTAAASSKPVPVMRGARIYALADGSSTSEHIEVPLSVVNAHGSLSKPISSAGSFQFRFTPAGWDTDFHNAPARQYIVMLDNGVTIETSDHKKIVIEKGEVVLVEDTHGIGHKSTNLHGNSRLSVFLPITGEAYYRSVPAPTARSKL